MPNDSNPIDGQPWPLSSFLRDSPLWAPSGVVGTPAAASTAGDLALSFDIVSGTSVTPKLALGRGRVRGGRYERTVSAWTSGMSGTAPQQGSATYPLNTGSNPRRDRIVLRRDAALQAVYPIILLGTPAASPTAAALTQVETGVWDEPLFSWTLPGGSSTAPAGILDERRWIDPDGGGRLYPWALFPAAGPPFLETGAVTGGTDGSAAGTLSYRREGNFVVMRGWGYSQNGLANNVVVSTALPPEFRPPFMVTLWPKLDAANPVPQRWELGVNGVVRAIRAVAAGSFLNFDDVSWPLS